MRASRAGVHTSGAERLVTTPGQWEKIAGELTHRAVVHEQGLPDSLTLTVEQLGTHPRTIPALRVEEPGDIAAEDRLAQLLADLPPSGLELARNSERLRGAALIDIHTGQRVEPDRARGVRVSRMDWQDTSVDSGAKSHFREALALATKAQSCPGVVAEVCVSDDPRYTTGYVARGGTYYRIHHIKPEGSPHGGRALFIDPQVATVDEIVRYLERTPVFISQRDAATAPGRKAARPALKLNEVCAERNAAWESAGLERQPRTFGSAQGPRAVIDGREYLLFSSSNYLGLAHHPEVVSAALQATALWGTGSGGSRLTTGTHSLHRELETSLAQWLGYEDCVLFATGYQANLSTLQALAGEGLEVYSDTANHASLIDGMRLATQRGAKVEVYPHLSPPSARAGTGGGTRDCAPRLIVTDGLFSMSGDRAPLAKIMDSGCWTMVDDAHGIGTLGISGRGVVEEAGLLNQERLPSDRLPPDILVGTLSKAFGAEGGFVCCGAETARLLRNQARSYVFSTSLSAGPVAAARESLRLIRSTDVVGRLHRNIAYAEKVLGMAARGVPILAVPVGDEARAMWVSQQLAQAGIWAPAIRYPTVPRGQAIIRITIMANHTCAGMDQLAEVLAPLLGGKAIPD
ncbi:hypothetical protein CPHO_10675 [Corynebacterium phocae]|uniref:7-keto-8-amino-pelargonic acid synthase n=2 Tax=Corynebacterium phocae TaxID=161895 RepID=A0A1L7D721_9CORY|nr:hypothetical protein CPHO_10675 [Corynebacterium phocae]